jgi:hypothetical protein
MLTAPHTAEPLLCSRPRRLPGLLDALSVRHVLAAMGPDTIAVIPPSCMAIIAGPQPYSSLKIPVYQPTLEASAAAASGCGARWTPGPKSTPRCWCWPATAAPTTSASSACRRRPSATRTSSTSASTTRAT